MERASLNNNVVTYLRRYLTGRPANRTRAYHGRGDKYDPQVGGIDWREGNSDSGHRSHRHGVARELEQVRPRPGALSSKICRLNIASQRLHFFMHAIQRQLHRSRTTQCCALGMVTLHHGSWIFECRGQQLVAPANLNQISPAQQTCVLAFGCRAGLLSVWQEAFMEGFCGPRFRHLWYIRDVTG